MYTKKPLYPKKNSAEPPADLAPKIFYSGRLNFFQSGKQPHVGCGDRVRECHCFLEKSKTLKVKIQSEKAQEKGENQNNGGKEGLEPLRNQVEFEILFFLGR